MSIDPLAYASELKQMPLLPLAGSAACACAVQLNEMPLRALAPDAACGCAVVLNEPRLQAVHKDVQRRMWGSISPRHRKSRAEAHALPHMGVGI